MREEQGMKLLMVDDEEYVVESIMEMVPVDIIISDIVMPRQSGFDFIHWVRDNKYTVQVIFLTSYAEFDYARHAIAMNSVDYLLKPIDYDKLAAAVGKAAEKVREARKNADDRTESRLWRQNQSLLRREFWMDLLRGRLAGGSLSCYAKETEFVLLYLTFYDGVKSQSAWDEKTLYFIMENVLSEMLEGVGYLVETVVPGDRGNSVTVCRKAEGCAQTVEQLKDKGVIPLHCCRTCGTIVCPYGTGYCISRILKCRKPLYRILTWACGKHCWSRRRKKN